MSPLLVKQARQPLRSYYEAKVNETPFIGSNEPRSAQESTDRTSCRKKRRVSMLVRAQNEARTESALFARVNRKLPTVGNAVHATKLHEADYAFITRTGRRSGLGKTFQNPPADKAPSDPTRRKTLPGGEVAALSLADNRRFCRLPKAKAYGL